MNAAELAPPTWAIASPRRRAHIARVAELAMTWADAMRVERAERDAWRDAARWHDALRDAAEPALRAIVPHLAWPASLLHGPAAAVRLAEDGERRSTVLEAVYWHTVGNANWDRTGRVLYMADYLEPGRNFDREERAALAATVATAFDGAFRAVVTRRLGKRVEAGEQLLAESAALWESVQSKAPPLVEPKWATGQRITVEVLNATTVRGLARRAALTLRDHGFDVVSTGTNKDQFDSTQVLDRTGHREGAVLAAKAMGGGTVLVRPDSSHQVDLTVLIGASWHPASQPFYP